MVYTVNGVAEILGETYARIYAIARDHNLGGDGKRKMFTDSDLDLFREIIAERNEKKDDTLKDIRVKLEQILEILQRGKE